MEVVERIRVVAAVIERGDRYLITQRRTQAALGGLWEFPGGKVDEGESDQAALIRELRERLGAHGEVVRKLGERHHAYEGYEVALALYEVRLDPDPPPHAENVQDLKWVASEDFARYRFCEADQGTMDQLLGIKR